jgi:hypothetical protein
MAGFQIVDNEEWSKHYNSRAKYDDAIQAIQFLIRCAPGANVKVEAGDKPHLKRKAILWQANRRKMSLRTYMAAGFIYIRRHDKVLSVKSTKGEINHQSGGTSVNNQRGPLTSRGRSLNTGVGA